MQLQLAAQFQVTRMLRRAATAVGGGMGASLVAKEGLVNNSASLTAETITCTVSSVVPTTELNLLGGDNLTFTGTQFPWDMKRSSISIAFNDPQATKCIP